MAVAYCVFVKFFQVNNIILKTTFSCIKLRRWLVFSEIRTMFNYHRVILAY